MILTGPPVLNAALALQLIGLYAFAGWTSLILPEGSLGFVLVRAGILAATLLAFGMLAVVGGPLPLALLPVLVFFGIYGLRLFENALVQNVPVPPDTTASLIIFVVSCVLSPLLFARMMPLVRDRGFHYAMMTLAVIFLLGLALNLDMLLASVWNRLSLEKINPIAMGHTASGFLLYLLVSLTAHRRGWAPEILLVLPLFLILVFARSRGAYVSTAAALLVFFLLRVGSRRVQVAALLMILALAANPGPLIEIYNRLGTIDASQDMSTMLRLLAYVGAWEQFLRDPLFGRYVIELQTQWYPHNIYLESLMSVGLVGTGFFLAHILIASWAAASLILRRDAPVFAVFIALMFVKEAVGNAFSGSLYGSNIFWLSSICAIAAWAGLRRATAALEEGRRTPGLA